MSDFGKGYAYCLGLFLAHAEKISFGGTWFNGAADHLYDMIIPPNYSETEEEEIEIFKQTCIKWRLEEYTESDKKWAIQKAKDLLRAYDDKNGVVTEKGKWE